MTKTPEQQLFADYEKLQQKYKHIMPVYSFNYALLAFTVKSLMDIAPRHKIALESIRIATEEGIKWHVEERGNHEHN